MTAILALGCLLAGFILGWLLRTIFSLAHISWSQEQMQRKVRYWQNEAIRARDIAEQLMQQLSAITGRKPEPPDWPTTDLG
jgi:uncharacterized membrane protein YciS (DUF1049 family)